MFIFDLGNTYCYIAYILNSPSSQKCFILVGPSVGCLSIIVQNNVRAGFNVSTTFAHVICIWIRYLDKKKYVRPHLHLVPTCDLYKHKFGPWIYQENWIQEEHRPLKPM